jgi:two-component system, response regulator
MGTPNQGTILLVEDNPDEVELMKVALEKAEIANPLQVVRDGQEALDYLKGESRFAARALFPLPCLVFLDLKLPRVSGQTVLTWLKSHPRLKVIPVIVLTSSKEPTDLTKVYELGANSFLTKPAKLSEFVEMVKTTATYWISGNRTPPLSEEP